MGRRKRDPDLESFLRRLVYLLDNGLYLYSHFEDEMKYLWYQAQKHDVGFTSVQEDGLYDAEWNDAATRYIYAGLGYDLFNFCVRYHLKWPEHADILLKVLYTKDEAQVFKTLTPDNCPPDEHWKMFRMARIGLGILTDQEKELAIKNTPGGRARNVSDGLVIEEICPFFKKGNKEVDERTVRNAIKACWRYIDQGGRVNAAKAIGWHTYLLDRAIENKKRKNKLP